ncbi:MAG: FtsX-like permease family protein, partial [Bacillota bacterium]|nr:FtsX-like permease family protein [Bacillota bacterium]
NRIPIQVKPISRVQVFEQLKQQNSFYLFLMSFIGLLFFVTSGSILYFKLNNDIDNTRHKYNILAKIGIGDKEMMGIIAKELKVVFFLPLILGTMLGYAFIWILTVNVSIRAQIMLNTLVIVGVYFIFQSIYYILAKRKYAENIFS